MENILMKMNEFVFIVDYLKKMEKLVLAVVYL